MISTKRRHILFLLLLFTLSAAGQMNTDRLTAIGRNALYFSDYVLSIQYFNQVIKLKPYLTEPYIYRAIAKIELGDYEGAERDCTTAIDNNPFLPGAFYTRGFVRMRQEKFELAEQDFTQALQFSPDNRTYILLRADVRSSQKKYDQALTDINYLINREPKTASFHFEKGTISLAMNDTLQALQCFSSAIDYDSQNPANYSARGLINSMLDNEDDALLDLTKAINLGSKWAGDYINRGILLYRKHNYRGALADYDKAVSLAPQDPACYYNRGLLREEVGDLNNALEDFNEAISLDAEKTEMLYQRGVVLLQLQQWQEAVNDFDTLISHYPYFLPSYYLAAQAKTALNDPKAAYQYQQTAHQLEENKEEIQRQQKVNTDVQLAQSQPQKRNRRKEFSQSAAQNKDDDFDDNRYQSESRGSVQKRYADVVNEPNIALSYYAQNQSLRRTHYFHFIVDQLNQSHTLPSPLQFTPWEVTLTADMVSSHFEAIDRLSNRIDKSQDKTASSLYLSRAIEFAIVGDYSSAIEDLNRCLLAMSDANQKAILYFLRANWRYKLLEYQRTTGELREESKLDFELIMRDYDQVILLCPDFAFAYYNKANILCTQKDFAAAIQYYTAAISSDADFAEAYFNRGLTYIFTDQTAEGLADLSKAGELGIYQAYNLISRFR